MRGNLNLYTGIMSVLISISIYIEPVVYRTVYGVTTDFTEIQLPLCGLFMTHGVLAIAASFFSKNKQIKTKSSFFICPKCEAVSKISFDPDKQPNLRCKLCGINLEGLEGFYQRHPELK